MLGKRAIAVHPSLLIAAASGILMVTTGIRLSMGLFVLPIVQTTGMSLVSISFALAVGQFMWGAAQPVFGAIADHYGSYRIMIAGALLLAAGVALSARNTTELGFVWSLGVMMSAGAAAGSFAVLIGAAAQFVAPQKRSMATGIINAGGSVGQLLFAPFSQFLIGTAGWGIGMIGLAVTALLTIPVAWLFRGTGSVTHEPPQGPAQDPALGASNGAPQMGLGEQLRIALRNRSYWCLHAGFFTCGFHIAFLVTHLPGDLQLCGLPAKVAANSLALIGLFNVAGSLAAGWLGQRYRMKHILALLYASRALVIVCYLLMPKTVINAYLIAGALGFSWLATVPPTAGLVGKLFGSRYLTTLFGLTLLSHQIGGFLGAWLGGVAMAQLGSYAWVWYADIALALVAAALNLPIREAAPLRDAEQFAHA